MRNRSDDGELRDAERRAVEFVMELGRAVGRIPEDVTRKGAPFDISSPPRKIFGGSARGALVPLEDRQAAEARSDPAIFYLYVGGQRDDGRRLRRSRSGVIHGGGADHAARHVLAHSSHRGVRRAGA
jgi:hypothetical protein